MESDDMGRVSESIAVIVEWDEDMEAIEEELGG
jgi:hypothetical protein